MRWKFSLGWLTAALACTANVNHSQSEAADMSKDEQAIKRAAAAEKGWREDELDVKPLPAIQLGKCPFYTVSHRVRPVHEAATYAHLPNGTVATQGDRAALEKILELCDPSGASAGTWAELLARFHWDVGPGRVMYEADPPIAAGEQPLPIAAPALAGGRVRFFLKNPETSMVYEVNAAIEGRRVSNIEKKKVGA